ncbi:MAG: helix-turn-helix transcriptional regulator [Pseudorhodobacter sp.]|nr:helix-turn-helix transcriptional regulator [Pseudorhodobacter sp.]MDZ4125113.1 helix-turn-helix transcriptional regulator [Hydrogenophaga sp.]
MSDHPQDKLLSDIGRRIREARGAQGLSLEQLARLTGISGPALSLIETAKRDARVTTLAKIARALRVPLADLLDNQGTTANDGRSPTAEGYDLGDYQ